MSIETARSFFLWCSIINYAILLLWVARHAWAGLVFRLEPVVPTLDRAVRHAQPRRDNALQDRGPSVQHRPVYFPLSRKMTGGTEREIRGRTTRTKGSPGQVVDRAGDSGLCRALGRCGRQTAARVFQHDETTACYGSSRGRVAGRGITLAPKKLIRTRRASEGSASEPSLARRVSMCKDAKLSCRGNRSRFGRIRSKLFAPVLRRRETKQTMGIVRGSLKRIWKARKGPSTFLAPEKRGWPQRPFARKAVS